MAFCTHCGAQLPDGARFCTSCGTPVAAAPAEPAPQPTQPAPQPRPQPARSAYTQPVQPQPTRPEPVRATTQGGGIVIDAPAGSTVTVSDAQPRESFVQAPSQTGEFTAVTWDEPGARPARPASAPGPAPQYRQPQYPAPQQPQYPQQPQAAPAKKKRSIWAWIGIILVGLVYLAMKMGW